MRYPLYKEEVLSSSKTGDELIIITKQNCETKKRVIVEYNGEIIKDEEIEMLSYEEQLDELLNLKLKVHPLEEDGCWGIFASTPQKAVERFALVKCIFPLTVTKRLDSCMKGDFGVDLYGKL